MNGDDAASNRSAEILHATFRGAVAAMAMTGMRVVTVDLGIVEQTPPDAMLKKASGLVRMVPRRKRRVVIQLAHWAYGAAGGSMFAALPDSLRRAPWAGPAYGLALWLGFEAGIAPVLGLKHAHDPRIGERIALAADHLLYGLVLSEGRERPQESS